MTPLDDTPTIMCHPFFMADTKTIYNIDWSEIFDKEFFAQGLIDPETLSGYERCHFLNTLFDDYLFYKKQGYDKQFLRLYETALSYMVQVYGH